MSVAEDQNIGKILRRYILNNFLEYVKGANNFSKCLCYDTTYESENIVSESAAI